MAQGKQHDGPAQQQGQQGHAGDRHVYRHDVAHGLAQIAEDAPALAHGTHDGGKVVVNQHDGRGLARHVGAASPHGHAHVRGLEGRRVVDTITRHGHHRTSGLQGLHDA
jgi:hypothetical protein